MAGGGGGKGRGGKRDENREREEEGRERVTTWRGEGEEESWRETRACILPGVFHMTQILSTSHWTRLSLVQSFAILDFLGFLINPRNLLFSVSEGESRNPRLLLDCECSHAHLFQSVPLGFVLWLGRNFIYYQYIFSGLFCSRRFLKECAPDSVWCLSGSS